MNKTSALAFIDAVVKGSGLCFDKSVFEGIGGVSRGTKGFRKGPCVFVAVFYGGPDPGIRVTVKDKLRRFPLETCASLVMEDIKKRSRV